MKIDSFVAGLGIAFAEMDQQLLLDSAEAYLRAGGVVALADWTQWSEETRAAFVVAGNSIWRERCALIGRASQSMAEAMYMDSAESGHDYMARLAVDFMVKRNLGKLEKASK